MPNNFPGKIVLVQRKSQIPIKEEIVRVVKR
jgi:hypothetical protein